MNPASRDPVSPLRNRRTEYLFDDPALIRIQGLAGGEHGAHADIPERDPGRSCVPCEPGKGRCIPEQHPWLEAANDLQVLAHLSGRHLEGGQEPGAQHAVAQGPHSILRAELDGRSPQDDLSIADIDSPPARRSPLGGHVVRDSVTAQIEHERLASRAAGAESDQAPRALGT